MKHLAYFLIIILFFVSANPTDGCTIVMVAKGKIVLAGNNEDWKNPKTKIWFIPAHDTGSPTRCSKMPMMYHWTL